MPGAFRGAHFRVGARPPPGAESWRDDIRDSRMSETLARDSLGFGVVQSIFLSRAGA
jgi:hypothetical protein